MQKCADTRAARPPGNNRLLACLLSCLYEERENISFFRGGNTFPERTSKENIVSKVLSLSLSAQGRKEVLMSAVSVQDRS